MTDEARKLAEQVVSDWLGDFAEDWVPKISFAQSEMLQQRIATAFTAHAAAVREGAWQPIETFDGRSEAVLVWCLERKNRYVAYKRGDLWFNFGGYNRYPMEEIITHWCELPPVPAALLAPPADDGE